VEFLRIVRGTFSLSVIACPDQANSEPGRCAS
jgi:hypothetical protein